jgi:hypothetical protein
MRRVDPRLGLPRRLEQRLVRRLGRLRHLEAVAVHLRDRRHALVVVLLPARRPALEAVVAHHRARRRVQEGVAARQRAPRFALGDVAVLLLHSALAIVPRRVDVSGRRRALPRIRANVVVRVRGRALRRTLADAAAVGARRPTPGLGGLALVLALAAGVATASVGAPRTVTMIRSAWTSS